MRSPLHGPRGVLAVVHGHGPRRVALRAQGDVSDRRADGRARSVPAHAGRRRPLRPRHGGRFEDVAWELSWEPSLPAAEHVDPLLRRAGIAKTILVLAHPDLAVSGTVRFAGRELVLGRRARRPGAPVGLQARVALDLGARQRPAHGVEGEPRPGAYLDGVSVYVPRLGRQLGPSTPVVGRFDGDDFRSTSPLRVTRQLEPLRADELALRGARRQAQGGRARSTPRAARSSASPTTTPTGTWPTATTARWPRCA